MNWTATYRLDSTLVAPYEKFTYFANWSGLPDHPPRDFKAHKTRHVAWFVSNCAAPNGRKYFVDELQKYIGKLHCFALWFRYQFRTFQEWIALKLQEIFYCVLYTDSPAPPFPPLLARVTWALLKLLVVDCVCNLSCGFAADFSFCCEFVIQNDAQQIDSQSKYCNQSVS